MSRRGFPALIAVGAVVIIAAALWVAVWSSRRETVDDQPTIAVPSEPAPAPMLKPKPSPAVQEES